MSIQRLCGAVVLCCLAGVLSAENAAEHGQSKAAGKPKLGKERPTQSSPPWKDPCSAVHELIGANGNRIPQTLDKWEDSIKEHGDGPPRSTAIPFSRSINPA